LVLKPLEDGSAGIELLGPVIGMLIHMRVTGYIWLYYVILYIYIVYYICDIIYIYITYSINS
jgi:hypothetical protein